MRQSNALASTGPDTHSIQTRFGEFLFDDSQILSFPDGIPGFETCRRFVLVVSEGLHPLSCLQGLDEPHPSFLLLDPVEVYPRYRGVLTVAERTRIGVDPEGSTPLVWRVVVSVAPERVSVNLKAPIVVNPGSMIGCQALQSQSAHPVDWPIWTA